MQTKLVNIRLEQPAIELLDKLAGKSLNRQSVARMLLIAAIDAVQANQGGLQFPLHFNVAKPANPISPQIDHPLTTTIKRR